jgi:hypothetical protein
MASPAYGNDGLPLEFTPYVRLVMFSGIKMGMKRFAGLPVSPDKICHFPSVFPVFDRVS